MSHCEIILLELLSLIDHIVGSHSVFSHPHNPKHLINFAPKGLKINYKRLKTPLHVDFKRRI